MYIWRSRTVRDCNVFGSSCSGITDLARFRFVFSPPDIRRKRVKSRMIYTDTLRGAYSRRHGITWCISAVYTSQPTQRVPAAASPPRSRARKTPEKYNSTISGAYALESLHAIIHARRMLLPWQFPPTYIHTYAHTRACTRYWPSSWVSTRARMHGQVWYNSR